MTVRADRVVRPYGSLPVVHRLQHILNTQLLQLRQTVELQRQLYRRVREGVVILLPHIQGALVQQGIGFVDLLVL